MPGWPGSSPPTRPTRAPSSARSPTASSLPSPAKARSGALRPTLPRTVRSARGTTGVAAVLCEEAIFGRDHGRLEVVVGAGAGPAEREVEGDGAGLEPEVAGLANPLDLLDGADLVGLGKQDVEAGGAAA